MTRKNVSFYYLSYGSSYLGSYLWEQASLNGPLLYGPFCFSSPSGWVISIYLVSV